MYTDIGSILRVAAKNGFAVLATSPINMEIARGMIRAASEKQAPIIFLLGQNMMRQHAKAEIVIPMIRALADEDISSLYPEAKRTASAHGDRGALRACTWGEKTGRMLQAVLESYEKEGESALAGTQIWVCSICGFIYIGDNPPALCPVCKVPDWKFEKIV